MARRVPVIFLGLGLALLVLAPVSADDVPDDARKYYEQAQDHLAKGDAKKAYSAISKGKKKNPDSVDFWALYIQIWRAVGKKEATLQEKILPKAEASLPAGSTTFDMLRYRLAEDDEARLAIVKTMVAKKPDQIEPKLLLARLYVSQGDDDLAEEILDAVLEKDPANEMALTTKGELMIESGFSRSALEYAEEQLADHDLPGLRYVEARALLLIAENDASMLERAEASARKAVAGRAEPAYVLALVDVLDRLDKNADAATLLEEHYEKTKDTGLGGRLGEFAFRIGHYEKARRGLAGIADGNRKAAKALALCHSRLGDAAKTKQVLDGLMADAGDDEKIWIALVDLWVGDSKTALTRLEGVDGGTASWVRAWTHAWDGDVASTKAEASEHAANGTRGGEEWLLPLVQALLLQKLGPKADTARKMIVDGTVTAGKGKVATATVPEEEPLITARSIGFMMRHVSYRVALDGSNFKPSTNFQISQREVDGKEIPVLGVVGGSDCSRDPARAFPFRPGEDIDGSDMTALMTALLGPDGGKVWQTATEAFTEGCAALVEGDYVLAKDAFAKAVAEEPDWARARLFGAAAQALGGDAAGAAPEAERAAKILVDDWAGRTVALLVRMLAGQDIAAEVKALSKRQEAYNTRRFEEL